MAVNKNSTGYTVTFAIILVTVCGTLLATLATVLKERQKANVSNEKRQFILVAAGAYKMEELKEMEQAQISEIFTDKITEDVFDVNGTSIAKEGVTAFGIDIVKEYKSTKNDASIRKYPMFKFTDGDNIKYIIPMAGNGLWGPIWGFIALGKDQNTIEGVVFDHKSETPGLGAKIAEDNFQDLFTSSTKKIMSGDKYLSVNVVKGGLKNPEHEVDAIAGATITSNGVGAMLRSGFKPYMKAFGLIN